jgi:hypothetical protein
MDEAVELARFLPFSPSDRRSMLPTVSCKG